MKLDIAFLASFIIFSIGIGAEDKVPVYNSNIPKIADTGRNSWANCNVGQQYCLWQITNDLRK